MLPGCLTPNPWSRHWISWNGKDTYNYAQFYLDPCQPSFRSSCRHILFPWWNFCASSQRHRLQPDFRMSHSADVTFDHVGHYCSPSNFLQKVWCQECLMSLGNQPVPGSWWMALHTDCYIDMILHLWWQKCSICMVFGMNLSWNRMSHTQSKTVQ